MAESPATQSEAAPVTAAEEISEFESLLNRQFKPKTDSAREAVQTAVKTALTTSSATRKPTRSSRFG
jgi:type VI secretion system protein ImpC